MHLSSRPNQRFPSVGSELTGKKDFNFSAEMLGACSTGRSLRMNTDAPAEQPGWYDTRIVEDEQFVTPKKIEYFKKQMIFEPAGGTVQEEKSRSFAPV